MPYPPKPNESEQAFLSRCIPVILKEKGLNKDSEDDRDQAVAICYSMYRNKKNKKHKSKKKNITEQILDNFMGEF